MNAQWTRRLLAALLPALGLTSAAFILLSGNMLSRVDLLLYDTLIRQQYRDRSPDVVIVAIDSNSLQRLGRWPWSRRLHASLLDRLTDLGVRAVAFDILMPEAETTDPEADRLLAEAMRRNGKTVLAVAPEQGSKGRLITESLPIPKLAEAAAALGHVDVELDVDGLCRSVYLRAGMGSAHWPSLSLALVETAYPNAPAFDDGISNPLGADARNSERWVRDKLILVPFVGPTGRIQRISYVDVLDGHPLDVELEDRLVIVGSTAAGLGDALATPATLRRDRMPGVEMNANIANALLEGKAIRRVSEASHHAITLGLVFLYTLVLAWPIRNGLLLVMSTTSAVLLASSIVLISLHLWFPPAVLIATVLASFPLWSWLQHRRETNALMNLRRRMEHHARHHLATGLPNREALHEYLQTTIENTRETDEALGLMLMHMERSGSVGESLGGSENDQLLQSLSERLRRILREEDLVAYMGNGEFAVLIRLSDTRIMDTTGIRLQEAFQHAIRNRDAAVYMTPRIGFSLYPDDGTDADSLIDNAYTAMIKARESRSNELCHFTTDMRHELLSRSRMEKLLREALQNGELDLHYQPQIITDDGRVIGVEVLLRWHNPQLGEVGPDVFIPVAERTGSILHIGTWVLEQACRQARLWEDRGLGKVRIAVNLSPVQFAQENLVEIVTGVLRETGLSAEQLELEVTESTLMHDLDAAVKALQALKHYGVSIAIDDFGTGYSSLSYLKRFPLDRLKIDRSFIDEIQRSSESMEITQAIIAMAHRLQLKVIAEGVENTHQAEFLQSHACDEMQGYLYGRPMPAVDFERWLESNQPRP